MTPLALNATPPLVDYPSHLARAVILHGGASLEVSRFYQIHWINVPNLAGDVIMLALLQAFEPVLAGRLLLAITITVQIVGMVVYARAALGRWTWWSLFGATAAYHGLFFFGFLNFSLACGLALIVAAGWRMLREQRPITATVVATIGLSAIWFSHVAGLLFALVLIGSYELTMLRPVRPWGQFLLEAARTRALPLLLPLGVIVLLYSLSELSEVVGPTEWVLREKPRRLLLTIASYQPWADIAAAGGCLLALAYAAWTRSLAVDRASLLAGAVCGILALVMPAAAKSGWWVDARFGPMVWMLCFSGVAPCLSGRRLQPIVALAALAIVARLASISIAWMHSGLDIADLRKALACVPRGASVLVVSDPSAPEHPSFRKIAFIHYWAYSHLGAWAVIDRDALYPALHAFAGQFPIRRDPAQEDRFLLTRDPSLSDVTIRETDGHTRLNARGLAFDYLVLLPENSASNGIPEGTELMRETAFAKLIRNKASTLATPRCE